MQTGSGDFSMCRYFRCSGRFPIWADMHIRKIYETRQANKTINASVYDYWAQQYWAANYTGICIPRTASNSDATPEDASATDAE